MTTEPPVRKPRAKPEPFAPRHVYGPRAIGAVLPAVTRQAYRSQGAAIAQLMIDWPSIVGPGFATTTIPRRMAAGTLTLGCAGPVALELQHLAGPLIERINGHLGRPVVQRLRFVQEVFAARPPALKPRPVLEPVAVDLPDGPLREALAALGARVRSERA
jgi:hypothetical protein